MEQILEQHVSTRVCCLLTFSAWLLHQMLKVHAPAPGSKPLWCWLISCIPSCCCWCCPWLVCCSCCRAPCCNPGFRIINGINIIDSQKIYCQVRAAVAAGQHGAGRGSVQWAADHHRGQERGWHVAPPGQEVMSCFTFSHEQRCFSKFPIKNRYVIHFYYCWCWMCPV